MTRGQFRWILSAYLIVVVLSIVVAVLTKSMIPVTVRELEAAWPTQSLPAILLLSAFFIGVIAAGLTGFIGMICFWPPARGIFLVAIFLKIFASPAMATWLARTG